MTPKTNWFPPSAMPERIGVYEAEWESDNPAIDDGEWFNLWDGRNWRQGALSTNQAATQKAVMPRNVRLIRWRGLTAPAGQQGEAP